MFYQFNELSSVLLCSFCQNPFVRDVAKSLPCGESICVACVDGLVESNKPCKSFKFPCKICSELHEMPKKGLSDNTRLMKLLSLESKMVSRGRQAERLRSNIEELKALSEEFNFEVSNPNGSIKRYFDKIRVDVEKANQRGIECFNKLKGELLDQIDECEADWLRKTTTHAAPDVISEDVKITTSKDKSVRFDELLIEIDSFSRKWSENFRSCSLNEDEVDLDLQTANYLKSKLCKSLIEHQRRIFNDRFLRFQPNSAFNEIKLGELCYFDSQNKKLDYVSTAQNMVFSMVLLTNGDHLASGCSDGEIQIWHVATGELVRTLKSHTKPVYTLAVLGENKLASGSFDRSIKIWNME